LKLKNLEESIWLVFHSLNILSLQNLFSS
jgi:hypothetical protein